jgi:hypothetical protein
MKVAEKVDLMVAKMVAEKVDLMVALLVALLVETRAVN